MKQSKIVNRFFALIIGWLCAWTLNIEERMLFFVIFLGCSCIAIIILESCKPEIKSIILASLFSFFIVISYSVEHCYPLLSGKSGIAVLLLAFFLQYGVRIINETLVVREEKVLSAWIWYILPIILFLGWLPHLLYNYPGSLCYDARDQLEQAFGFLPLDNKNPVFDTLLYGTLFKAGRQLTGIDNAGITVIAFTQYLLMALSFSCAMYEGLKLTQSKVFIVGSVLFYILIPIFGGAGQIILKDSLHMSMFVFMFASQLRVLRKPTKKAIVLYAISVILVSITRAMALVYAVLGGVLMVLVFVCRRRELGYYMLGAVSSAIGVVLLWECVILPHWEIKEYPSVEKYCLPFNQIAYVVVTDELSETERVAIDSVLNVERIKTEYTSNSADYLKVIFHEGDMTLFWKFYLTCYLKHTKAMIKGPILSYHKYVYPLAIGKDNYRSYIADCSGMGLNLYYKDEVKRLKMENYIRWWEQNPLLKLFMGPGLYCWILLFCVMFCRSNLRVSLIPLILLFLGLFFTPINGETRYAFPILATSPLMVAMCTALSDESKITL